MSDVAKIVEVILVCTVVGDGTPGDPTRQVKEIWTKEGELICVLDPISATESPPPLL